MKYVSKLVVSSTACNLLWHAEIPKTFDFSDTIWDCVLDLTSTSDPIEVKTQLHVYQRVIQVYTK